MMGDSLDATGPRSLLSGELPMVLASGSTYRARLLTEAGFRFVVDAPEIDERAADDLLATLGPAGLALELARRKAVAVGSAHPRSVIVAADQIGVVGEGPSARVLTKQPDAEGAVDQLMAMSGTSHRLVNGVVVYQPDAARFFEGVDEQLVTMRPFTESEARRYVEMFQPLDTCGSYRLEDAEHMDRGEALVSAVRGEHDSGVLGLPLPLLDRLLQRLVTVED